MRVMVPSKMAATSASVCACCLSGSSTFGEKDIGVFLSGKTKERSQSKASFQDCQKAKSGDQSWEREGYKGGEDGKSQTTSVIWSVSPTIRTMRIPPGSIRI